MQAKESHQDSRSVFALATLRSWSAQLEDIRHDFHAHPEIGLETPRTSERVAQMLASWGIETHTGIGGHGVVGVLRKGGGSRSIGLRADMDALPMQEGTGLPYASHLPGRMHACGHDGHTTMLLAAARLLAEHGVFDGTVNFIFQPGEEGCGGAKAMLKDRLLERFPAQRLYAMHTLPGRPIGTFAIAPREAMCGGAFFDIQIGGREAHAARPEESADPVLAACHLGTALQSIVSRNVSALDQGVVSLTRINAGDTYNIIPKIAHLTGSVRALRNDVMREIEARMRRICEGVALTFGVEINFTFDLIFAPLTNDPTAVDRVVTTATEIVGEQNVDRNKLPSMASEDFSFMLQNTPGAYVHIGNGVTAPVHNSQYDFNDQAMPYGAALFALVAEQELRGIYA